MAIMSRYYKQLFQDLILKSIIYAYLSIDLNKPTHVS